LEYRTELSVVLLLQRLDLCDKLGMGREHPSNLDEGAHDLDVDGDARGLRRMLESIATPCSVKAYGRLRRPPRRRVFEVTDCDLNLFASTAVIRNMKSDGKRLRFRSTA
jgi:hypothetical protein